MTTSPFRNLPNQSLLTRSRMIAWAARYGLVKSKAKVCLRTVLGQHCRWGKYPHRFFDDRGCQIGARDDHVHLWYIPNSEPQIYVYTCHEYNIPAPQVSVSQVDQRGLKHTAHPLSWYNTKASMHVVTVPQVDETFPYLGEFPNDMGEFIDMYYQVMKQSYQGALTPWDTLFADHKNEYS